MKRRKILGSDSMSQQQLWPSGTPSMTNSIRKLQHCCCCNNRGTATHKSSSSSGGSSSTMYAYKTDFSILRRHLNHHRTYFYTYWNKKKGKRHKKKIHHPGFELQTPSSDGQQPTCQSTLFLVYIDRYMCTRYVSIRIYE